MSTDALTALDAAHDRHGAASATPVDLDAVAAETTTGPSVEEIQADLDAAQARLAALREQSNTDFKKFFAADTIESIMKQQEMIEEDFNHDMALKTGEDYSTASGMSLGDVFQFGTVMMAEDLKAAMSEIRELGMTVAELSAQVDAARAEQAQAPEGQSE